MKNCLFNHLKINKMFLKYSCKTLPEAQWTKGIDSKSGVISTAEHEFKNKL